MKYIITFLFLCASTVFGAVPSFQAFDANFFQITGTGNNSIKIKTNNFTWGGITGGSGDSVWTNSAGVIQPVSTNAIQIGPLGGVRIGNSGIYPSSGVTVESDAEVSGSSDNGQFTIAIFDYSGAGLDAEAHISGSIQSGVVRSRGYFESTEDGYTTWNHFGWDVSPSNIELRATNETSTLFLLKPTAADGTTPYTFDTSVAHTSDSLLEVKNAGTNKVSVSFDGTISIGPSTADWFGNSQGSIYAWRDWLFEPGSGQAFLIGMTTNGTEETSSFVGTFDDATTRLRLRVRDNTMVLIEPTASAGDTPYVYDTSIDHTSGNLLEVKNNGTTKFSVAWDGTVNIDQANIGSATFTNVYFLSPLIASNGVASYAANAPVAITASGWTNSYSVNAIAEIDAAAADLKYFIKNSAGTGVYTNLASSTVWHATAILQPGGAVVITAGTTPSGTARPF